MWKVILQRRHTDNVPKYSNLTNIINTIRTLLNSNADPERMFSLLNNLKTKTRNSFSTVFVNAICVFMSALKIRGETALNMLINEEHLSLMSADKLYAANKNNLKVHADVDVASPSCDK